MFFSRDYYAQAGIWNSLTLAALAVFLVLRAPKSRTKYSLLVLNIATLHWAIFYSFWILAENIQDARIFQNLFSIGGLLAVPLTLHFVVEFLNLKVEWKWMLPNYLLTLGLVVTNFLSFLYVSTYAPIGPIPFYPQAGVLLPFSLLLMTANLAAAFRLLYRELILSSGHRAQQIKWILVGLVTSWVGGASTYVGFFNFNLPPVLTPSVSFFVAVFAYAVIRHQLMDVEVVIRKTVVFAGIFLSALLVVSLLVNTVPKLFLESFNIRLEPFWMNVLTLVVSFYGLSKLRLQLIVWTDRYLFQKEIDPQSLMMRVLTRTSRVTDSAALSKQILSEIVSGLRLKSASLFVYQPKWDHYEIKCSEGNAPSAQSLDTKNPLKCLSLIQQPAGFGIRPPSRQMPEEAFAELKKLNAQIAIPIMNERQMSAILFLGERMSEKPFSYDDLDFLVPLSRILSAIYHNTRLREELKVAQTKVIEAHTDGLTGALTRTAFLERLEVEFIRARHFNRPFAILMTDLDHFKAKNDNYGHQAGDAILAEAAKRMKASLRQQDIIGRYGGEEFIIFLSGASRAEALEVGERIRKRVDQSPVNVKGQLLVQTVSVGIACFPDDGQTTESLIHRADSCLYIAKKGGRNMVVDASSTESLAVKSGTGSLLRA